MVGYPIVNDPLYNHPVFGPEKGKGGLIGKTDEQLIQQLISIHNAENWLGIEGEDGGGSGNDMFGSGVANSGGGSSGRGSDGGCHPTGSGPSSCTSVHSDNGSSIGSTVGDGFVETCNLAVATSPSFELVPDVKHEETQVAFPALDKNAEKVTIAAPNDGKVTVGTQTTEEDTEVGGPSSASSCVGSTAVPVPIFSTCSAQLERTQGPECLTSGMHVASAAQTCAFKGDDGNTQKGIVQSLGLSGALASYPVGDNNNCALTPITSKLGGPLGFKNELMTFDPHCYECKVRYRDPKPKDLVMYLHALTYKVSPELLCAATYNTYPRQCQCHCLIKLSLCGLAGTWMEL